MRAKRPRGRAESRGRAGRSPGRREAARIGPRPRSACGRVGGRGDRPGGRARPPRDGRVHSARELRARRPRHRARREGPRRRRGARLRGAADADSRDRLAENRRGARRGRTARASALLADAERDFARKKELVAKESVSQAAFERSEAAFEGAKASRLGAQAGLDLAKQRLSDAVLGAPVDGVVLERRVDVGERLSEGTVTFVVVQTAPLRLRFRVPERFLGAAERGAKVHATGDPYPGETFDGTVSVVVPALDPASRTFAVEALFPNRDGRLRTGLFARVELERPAAKR
ncbi:MAG: efflux RND transporter periplasmic adaptor subunit [Holophagales bacterium]|nr:efflux RND transporter periplasmic adaptor subunit [Holophagales bacterium]